MEWEQKKHLIRIPKLRKAKEKNKNQTIIKLELKKKKHNKYWSSCTICTWTFLSFTHQIFPHQIFSTFGEENFLVGPSRPIIIFHSLPLNQKSSKKFPLFILSLSLSLSKIHSSKYTLSLPMEIILHWILRNEIQRMENVCSVPISPMGFLVPKDQIKYKILRLKNLEREF